MRFFESEQYNIEEPEEIATIENITKMCGLLITQYGLNGKGWQVLREDLYKFCLDEIEQGGPHGPYTLNDMESRVAAFYQGYMSCHHYWQRELGKCTLGLKEKYHIQ